MHLRLSACSVLPVILVLTVEPLALPAAAQELRQCSIEGQPCGTPQQLYERIQRCLQDPNLCRNVRITRAGDNPGDAPAHPAPRRSSPAPASNSLPTKRVVHEQAVNRRQAAGAPAGQPAAESPAAGAPAAAQPGGLNDAVAKAANDLPLDPAVKALNDTMPGNAAAVERRLGLRRTRVPGVDMRQRTPTPAEIVDALEPAKDPHR